MNMSEKDKTEFREFFAELASQISDKQIIKTTHATMAVLGVDVENPRAMRQDFDHLRNRRLDREDTAKSVKNAAARWTVTAILAAAVSWFVTHAPGGTN